MLEESYFLCFFVDCVVFVLRNYMCFGPVFFGFKHLTISYSVVCVDFFIVDFYQHVNWFYRLIIGNLTNFVVLLSLIKVSVFL